MQKPTNNFTTSKFTTSGGGQEGWDLPGLALSGIQTWLKLRTRYQVSGARHGTVVATLPGVYGSAASCLSGVQTHAGAGALDHAMVECCR